jgi:hypothetical protein
MGEGLLKLWGEEAKQAKARKGPEAEDLFKTGRICAVAYCCHCNEHAFLQTLPNRPLHSSRISHTCQSYDSVEHCKLSEAGHDVSGVRCWLGCCYLVISDTSLVWVTPSSLWDSWCGRRNSFCFGFYVRYELRLKKQFSLEHIIRCSTIRWQHSDGWQPLFRCKNKTWLIKVPLSRAWIWPVIWRNVACSNIGIFVTTIVIDLSDWERVL